LGTKFGPLHWWGKPLGSIVSMGKIAASVLLKLFINGYEKCHITDPLAHERNSIECWVFH